MTDPELVLAFTITQRPRPSNIFTAATRDQITFGAKINFNNYWPEDLRDDVLDFIRELAEKDSEAKARAEDERRQPDPLAADADTMRDRVKADLEQMGWMSPEDAAARLEAAKLPAWAQPCELDGEPLRTPEQRDPRRHQFEALLVPGLTTRCAWCGTAAKAHEVPA